jgi:hypothetical protein
MRGEAGLQRLRAAAGHMTKAMTKAMTNAMTKGMTQAPAPVEQFADQWLRLGFELGSPAAESLQRNPVYLAILPLIQRILLLLGLVVHPPKHLAVTLPS